jgi:hypothetical protein
MQIKYTDRQHEASFVLPASQPVLEEDYAVRLREVENVLLCQALGGQLPQPGSHLRLQRYLNGEISRAEAFQRLCQPASPWAN